MILVSINNAVMALTCNQGYGYHTASNSCIICPAGTFSPGGENVPCYYCCEGTYAPNQGMSACLTVPAGYYGTCSSSCTEAPCDDGYHPLSLPGGFPVVPLAASEVMPIATTLPDIQTGDCPRDEMGASSPDVFCGIRECPVGYYCPAGTVVSNWGNIFHAKSCPTGKTTSGTGAKSASECTVCEAGYGGSSCTACSSGYYKSSTGSGACSACSGRTKYTSATGKTSCSTVSNGYYTTGCDGSGNACTGQSACGTGYYCVNGVQYGCGDYATTNTTTATSADECICMDGYEKQADGTCAEPAPKQTPCSAGVSTLHAGDYTYPLYNECESPALWIGTENGNCCVNLTVGMMSGALNIDYGGTVYHATN